MFGEISSLGARLVYRSGLRHAAGLAVMMGLSALAYYGFQKEKIGTSESRERGKGTGGYSPDS